MDGNTAREEIKGYLKRYFSDKIQTKSKKYSDEKETDKTIDVRAEHLLNTFEKDLLIHEVKQIIINDCKYALLKPTKFKKIAEPSTFIISILVSILFASLAFFITTPTYIQAIIYACLVLSVAQVILHTILKDHT